MPTRLHLYGRWIALRARTTVYGSGGGLSGPRVPSGCRYSRGSFRKSCCGGGGTASIVAATSATRARGAAPVGAGAGGAGAGAASRARAAGGAAAGAAAWAALFTPRRWSAGGSVAPLRRGMASNHTAAERGEE